MKLAHCLPGRQNINVCKGPKCQHLSPIFSDNDQESKAKLFIMSTKLLFYKLVEKVQNLKHCN